ncbi:hypothetical protein HK096_002100, partial [Nowakowskiella sp. JEL0078]
PNDFFDVIFQNDIAFGIPKDKWEDEIKELVRITKPGGFIELCESETTTDMGPLSEMFFEGMRIALQSRGFGENIVQCIPKLLQSHGIHIQGESILSILIGWGGEIGQLNLKHAKLLFESFKPWLSDSFEIGSEDYDNMVENTYHRGISTVGRKIELLEPMTNEEIGKTSSKINQTWENGLEYKKLYPTMEIDPDLLPDNVQEDNRLEITHNIHTHIFGRLFHAPIEEKLLQSNSQFKVLDVGCGSGYWIRDMAIKYPNVEFHGFDISKTLKEDIDKLPNVMFVAGNVLNGIPFPDNYFDFVYQRMLIGYIPKHKCDDELKELNRVVKPDGYLELVEMGPDMQRMGPICDKFLKGLSQISAHRDVYLELGWNGKIGEINLENFQMIGASMKPWLSNIFNMTSEEYEIMQENMNKEIKRFQTYQNGIALVGRKNKIDLSERNYSKTNNETRKYETFNEEFDTGSPDIPFSTDNETPINSTSQSSDLVKLNEKIAVNWKPQSQHTTRDDSRLDNRRRFHADEDSPYALPADIEEQDRLEIQHLLIKHLYGE